MKLSAIEAEEARKRQLRDSRLHRLLQVRQQAKEIASQRRNQYKHKLKEGLTEYQVG